MARNPLRVAEEGQGGQTLATYREPQGGLRGAEPGRSRARQTVATVSFSLTEQREVSVQFEKAAVSIDLKQTLTDPDGQNKLSEQQLRCT